MDNEIQKRNMGGVEEKIRLAVGSAAAASQYSRPSAINGKAFWWLSQPLKFSLAFTEYLR